jgi:hypothetical protein
MKARPIPKPTAKLIAKCNADDQFEKFDRILRSVISVPKTAIVKEEAKQKRWKKKRA